MHISFEFYIASFAMTSNIRVKKVHFGIYFLLVCLPALSRVDFYVPIVYEALKSTFSLLVLDMCILYTACYATWNLRWPSVEDTKNLKLFKKFLLYSISMFDRVSLTFRHFNKLYKGILKVLQRRTAEVEGKSVSTYSDINAQMPYSEAYV